jgi:hypothetical protein
MRDAKAFVQELLDDGALHREDGPFGVIYDHGPMVVIERATSYQRIAVDADGYFHGSMVVPIEYAREEWMRGGR